MSGSYYPNQGIVNYEMQQNTPSQSSVQYMDRVMPGMEWQQYAMQQQALAQSPQAQAQMMQNLNINQLVQQQVQQQTAALHGQIQQAVQGNISQYVSGLQNQISLLQGQQQRPGSMSLQLPYQDIAGQREYPDLLPFPIPQTKEMFSGVTLAQRYGVDNSTCVATFPTQSAVPYYAVAFRFGLLKTTDELGVTTVLGSWLPLSAKRLVDFSTATITYNGRDFQFNIESSGQNLIWQSGDIPSEQADGDERFGYVLPCEVKVAQGETIILSATPVGAVVPGAEWRLFVTMFGYKMVNHEQLISLASARRIEDARHLSQVVPTQQQVQQVQMGNYPSVYTAG